MLNASSWWHGARHRTIGRYSDRGNPVTDHGRLLVLAGGLAYYVEKYHLVLDRECTERVMRRDLNQYNSLSLGPLNFWIK